MSQTVSKKSVPDECNTANIKTSLHFLINNCSNTSDLNAEIQENCKSLNPNWFGEIKLCSLKLFIILLQTIRSKILTQIGRTETGR